MVYAIILFGARSLTIVCSDSVFFFSNKAMIQKLLVQFNIVHFRPTCVRGMHYHDHFVEYSLCVNGSGMFVYRLDKDYPKSERSLNITKGFCVRIPKQVVHTIYSVDELTMVAMLTKQWDYSNPPIVQVGEIPKPNKI